MLDTIVNSTHPDVEFIYNMFPVYYLVPLFFRKMLNFVLFIPNMFFRPFWFFWNFLTIIPHLMVTFFTLPVSALA